nr:MAG TPA: hypothetical protein [Caudoviricetes sp.]DAZ55217.1 MAG TPA: hypothetical protein [Caudoviricetes sp.]
MNHFFTILYDINSKKSIYNMHKIASWKLVKIIYANHHKRP